MRPPSVVFAILLLLALGGSGVAAQLPDSLRLQGSASGADTLAAVDSVLVADSLTDTPAAAPFVPLPAEAVVHLDHLTEAFPSTPGGAGLIPTGLAEAEIALEHVRLAGRDSTSLGTMTSNVAHVLNAIDPNEVGTGYGLGFGVKRAAEETLLHMDFATRVPDVSETLLFHAAYVSAAAESAIRRADQAVALARRIQRAASAEAALPLVEDLAELVRAMAYGNDADGDGRIGYDEAEMGLAQAAYHLALVRRVERLGN